MAKIPRPRVLGGITVRKATGCGNMYVQLNWYRGRLFEIFATLGHSGGCAMSYTEALTRSITAGLRQETPVPIEEYIDQLHDIRCLNPLPFPKEEATLSCPDAIAKALREYGSLTVEEVVEIMMGSDGGVLNVNEEEGAALKHIEELRIEREKLEDDIR